MSLNLYEACLMVTSMDIANIPFTTSSLRCTLLECLPGGSLALVGKIP